MHFTLDLKRLFVYLLPTKGETQTGYMVACIFDEKPLKYVYMHALFHEKYETAEADEYDLLNWEVMEQNKYGFVYVNNPHYLIDGDDRKYLIRKPTPKERREIVINTVIECNGRTFRISTLAERLRVTDRTVQSILRQLQKDGLIEISPRHYKNGKQKCNAYRYIGEPCEKYGSGLTLNTLYNATQNAGFRDWAWQEYEFSHNKIWHSIYPLCKEKFKSRVARKKYLIENNLPLTILEDIKYLVLRYCYWKGAHKMLEEQYNHGCMRSKDGTIKIAIEPINRTENVPFFGYTLSVEIAGAKSNPQITVSNTETKEILGVFTWFDENIIQSNKTIDDNFVEQFFILGDFTTR